MPIYNLTGLGQNSTDLVGLFQGVNNTLTQGWLFTFILIGISIVLFTSFLFKTNEPDKSLLATAFISFVLAALLRALDLVPNIALYIILIIAGGVTAFTIGKKS